jgi:UDP-3-O-[3-hydroxymyristoyl] N-acetylglucosamine deacetylase
VLGSPLLAAYSAFRSGHAMNNQLLRALLDATDSWEYVTFDNACDAPAGFAELPKAW